MLSTKNINSSRFEDLIIEPDYYEICENCYDDEDNIIDNITSEDKTSYFYINDDILGKLCIFDYEYYLDGGEEHIYEDLKYNTYNLEEYKININGKILRNFYKVFLRYYNSYSRYTIDDRIIYIFTFNDNDYTTIEELHLNNIIQNTYIGIHEIYSSVEYLSYDELIDLNKKRKRCDIIGFTKNKIICYLTSLNVLENKNEIPNVENIMVSNDDNFSGDNKIIFI